MEPTIRSYLNESEYIYLDHFDDWNPSKYFSIAFSLLTILIGAPMLSSVISYEHNCHNRTLLNRLISSNVRTLLIWNLTVQPILIFRYLTGPYSYPFCQFEYLLKNVLTIKVGVYIIFITVLRYLFIFRSKNPTAIQDDFWTLFLEIWAMGFASICQITTLMYPSREPTMLYICNGKFPQKYLNHKVKSNISFTVVALLAIIMHVVLSLRYMIYKILERKETNRLQNVEFSVSSYLKEKLNGESLFSLTSNYIKIVFVVISGVVPSKINSLDPRYLHAFPNYLFIYTHHFISMGVGTMIVAFVYFFKNRQLLAFHKRQCKEFYEFIKERCFS